MRSAADILGYCQLRSDIDAPGEQQQAREKGHAAQSHEEAQGIEKVHHHDVCRHRKVDHLPPRRRRRGHRRHARHEFGRTEGQVEQHADQQRGHHARRAKRAVSTRRHRIERAPVAEAR